MRTIKFRGKRVDNGEWVYGHYATMNLTETGGVKNTNVIILENSFYAAYEWLDDFHEIDKETLGQFTGLVDKNGKEIYEGDILSVWRLGFNKIFEVKWRDEGEPKYILYPQPFNEDWWTCRSDMQMSWEVIGNIHDNPELMNK